MSKRASEPQGEEGGERWVISYADLVTLLLGFFIILYASSKVDADKFKALAIGLNQAFSAQVRDGAPGGSPVFDGGRGLLPGPINTGTIQRDLDAIATAIKARAGETGISGQVVVSRLDDTIVIRMPNQLLFGSASADMRPEAAGILGVVASVVADVPHQVRIEGHTDNVPVGTERYPSNWELSSARATAVLRALVDRGAIAPSRISAAGYAEYRPVASNDIPEGRALNRRADIVLLYPGASDPASSPPQPAR